MNSPSRFKFSRNPIEFLSDVISGVVEAVEGVGAAAGLEAGKESPGTGDLALTFPSGIEGAEGRAGPEGRDLAHTRPNSRHLRQGVSLSHFTFKREHSSQA